LTESAEARQVDAVDAVLVGQRRDGGEEGRLGPAEAVEHHDVLALRVAGACDRDVAHRRAHAGEHEPARLARPAGGGEEADAEVEVVADLQPPAAERVHPAPQVPPDPRPGRGIGRQPRVRPLIAIDGLEPLGAAADHEVPLAGLLDTQPQPRTAGGSVEGGAVEALDQLLQNRGSGGHAASATRSPGAYPQRSP
jgi:hypothetical protein